MTTMIEAVLTIQSHHKHSAEALRDLSDLLGDLPCDVDAIEWNYKRNRWEVTVSAYTEQAPDFAGPADEGQAEDLLLAHFEKHGDMGPGEPAEHLIDGILIQPGTDWA
jgi:hypothetical protein